MNLISPENNSYRKLLKHKINIRKVKMKNDLFEYQRFLENRLEFKVTERNHEMFKNSLKKIRSELEVDYETHRNDMRVKQKIYYPYTILD